MGGSLFWLAGGGILILVGNYTESYLWIVGFCMVIYGIGRLLDSIFNRWK